MDNLNKIKNSLSQRPHLLSKSRELLSLRHSFPVPPNSCRRYWPGSNRTGPAMFSTFATLDRIGIDKIIIKIAEVLEKYS